MIDPTATPPAATTATASTAVSAATSVANAVQVEIADLTQALADLTRAIQTSGTVTAPPNGNTLTLATALGNVTVTLPQLTSSEQQTLIQQLTTLAQTQRPLTLALQPGSPPSQAVLLIPSSANTAPIQNAANPAQPPPLLPLPQIAPGETLPAVVLPTNIPLPGQTAPPAASPLLSLPPTTIAAPQPASATALSPPALPQLQMPSAQPPQSTPAATPTSPAPPSASTVEPTLPPPPSTAAPSPQATSPAPQSAPSPAPSLPTPQAAAPPLTLTTSPPPTTGPTLQPPAPMPALATLLQPGNEVNLHIDAVLPPQTTPPPLAANQIAATVIGTGTDGQLILKAGDATLFVKAQVAAPPGATLIITVDPARAPPLIPLPLPDTQNFQALPQALAALAQLDPSAMQQMLTRMPQPNEVLPAALMLLFGAFKQSDARAFLGDDATQTLLRAGKTELIASIARELGGAGAEVQDSTVGQWSAYPIPLYSHAQFQSLMLYVHNDKNNQQEKDGGKSQDGGKKTRFLIDMRLSKLGALQLDGFVQPKKLDMVLRSEHTLPEGLHRDLRTAYIKAVDAVGFTGSLNFQVGHQHWLNMQRPTPPGIVT